MRKVSDSPKYLRNVFPFLWAGACIFLAVNIFLDTSLSNTGALALLATGLIGFILSKIFSSYLIDDVFDEGDYLLFRKGDLEQRVYLHEIEKIKSNDVWLILSLSNKGIMGRKLRFVLPSRLFPFFKHPYLKELEKRVSNARST